jgi:ferrochelatase
VQPYTDETMMALPKQGVKNIQVICPGFSADCLETIEEIGEENREYFEEILKQESMEPEKMYAYIRLLNEGVDAEEYFEI